MQPSAIVTIDSLLTGRVQPIGTAGKFSGIAKQATLEPLAITLLGIEGDEQADTRHHGGRDKAIHHYAAEHYRAWREEFPLADTHKFAPGGFGENISTVGLTEETVCLGDRFRLGGAEVQVSQPRQPCWKLNVHLGHPRIAHRVQSSGRTGWYYRVLRTGTVSAGDTMELLERPLPQWPLSRIIALLYHDMLNTTLLAEFVELETLPQGWRELALGRLRNGRVEDWESRLSGLTE